MEVLPEELPKKKRKIPSLWPGFPELQRSDCTINPSYTNFHLDYRVVCRHRYHFAKVAQHKQFTKELHSFERLQWNALDGVRVHREFTQGIISHKLPNRQLDRLTPDPLTSKQRTRVEYIVSRKYIQK